MNVVFIYSSPRKKSITSLILSEIEKSVFSAHKIDSFNINLMHFKACIGCLKCRPDKKCILPNDDAHILSEKIRRSDLIILGAPTYWGNIPGNLKMFFDRCVTTFESVEVKSSLKKPIPLLKGKRAIIVISSASPFPYNLLLSQSRGTIKALKTLFKAGGVKVMKIINISDSYSFTNRKKKKYINTAKKIGLSITI